MLAAALEKYPNDKIEWKPQENKLYVNGKVKKHSNLEARQSEIEAANLIERQKNRLEQV